MTETERSVVLLEPEKMQLEEFLIPQVSDDDGVLKTEVIGVCGSDVFHFLNHPGPVILGHEIVGTISDLGSQASKDWGVKVGDRVVVEATFGCGRCNDCRLGFYRQCDVMKGYGGSINSTVPPYLWGGYGQYVYMPPTARVHKISVDIEAEVAVLICAVLGNGIRWARTEGGISIGETAVIVGPGPQGLAATIAAKESGAKNIIVVGLARDEARLDMALRFGATRTIATDSEDIHFVVTEITDGLMADLVIDVTNTSTSVAMSLDLVARRGTLVLGGGAEGKLSPLPTDRITAEEIKIVGVNTHDSEAVRQALMIAERGLYPLGDMVSHRFAMDQAERAIRILSGEIRTEGLVKVVMYPETG